MEHYKRNKNPEEHVASIYKEYTTPSRVLSSFTNLSNAVIETALSGQIKFVFEILQNADDAYEDQAKAIEVKFILDENYLVVQHNGKGFDYNDVERICDYASQIEEVKANDLSKTGYKGLGFKSLFNISDCIYIYSNGYSFRFDKSYWLDSASKPWQVIPIWCRCQELPLRNKYLYDQSVNIILKVNDVDRLKNQMKEVSDQPELLLYMHRINKFSVSFNNVKNVLERTIEDFGLFNKIIFYKNGSIDSTWISRTYKQYVPLAVRKSICEASKFIYPEKIKNAKEIPIIFALKCNKDLKKISKTRGLIYCTVPTFLHLTLPYHIHSFFILNLDRSQLHENEWNEYLIYQIGYLQFNLLEHLASVEYLKNYVIELLVRGITHDFKAFSQAFLKGFNEAKAQICWIPPYQGPRLLKLGEVWRDDIEFFKQNFQNIQDNEICPRLINYDVRGQDLLKPEEATCFSVEQLVSDFPTKYYPQLVKTSYIDFINYLWEKSNINWVLRNELYNLTFLVTKNGILSAPKNALLEKKENPIPDFLFLNPVDNEYLPVSNLDDIQNWLVQLGAKLLSSPIEVIRKSILRWIDSREFDLRVSLKNHIEIMNYLAKGTHEFTGSEIVKLKEKLLILTESNNFKPAKLCLLPNVISVKEIADIISNDEIISSSYDIDYLKQFFIRLGVHNELEPINVLRKSILKWIETTQIYEKLTVNNYQPIIEYLANLYPSVKPYLTVSEKVELKKLPILTCNKVFQDAKNCYFDFVVPNVKGFENIIPKYQLILTVGVPPSVPKFLAEIGVSIEIDPVDVIRRSILTWIQDGEVTEQITMNNHYEILHYIAEHRISVNKSGLMPLLKTIPILTKNNNFKAANSCFWSPDDDTEYDNIPGIEFAISSEELVSSEYSYEIKIILRELGVRSLKFINIYEKYIRHLTCQENIKWFFSQVVNLWNSPQTSKKNVIIFLRDNFKNSSYLLAKNGKTYPSTELYSSCFDDLHDIDSNSIPLLDYEKLPEDLESHLGFRTNLDLKCILQLLKTFDKNPKLGKERTQKFFTTLLEQLRKKEKKEIGEHQLRLLSKENKLKPAKDLYYFIEEESVCYLKESYLKRIQGMTHAETLELAELCGVNVLPFKEEIKLEMANSDDTLKEFYLQRLPFIVVQESRELNEELIVTLKRLYDQICLIKLHKCASIHVKYEFGYPVKIYLHLKDLTLHVAGQWKNKKTRIHSYLKEKLGVKTDIRDIIDLEEISDMDVEEWFCEQKEDPEKFHFIVKELKNLVCTSAGN